MLYEQLTKRLQDLDTSRYLRLQNYYQSSSDILGRTFNDTTKPNNKIVNNYAAYIVDIIQGYFIGKPVSYTCEDSEYLEEIQEILDDNDERVHNTKLAKQIGIKGKCYEVVYLDEKGSIQFAKVNAENMIPIYSNEIKPKLLAMVRVWNEDATAYWEMYADSFISKGKFKVDTDKKAKLEIISEQEHFFGEIPCIEYTNNEEELGDFERVISLIDAYDKAQSDTANDFEYFTDAYLVMTGNTGIDVIADADGVAAMRQKRLIQLPEGCSASFLIKSINDAALENYKNRLRGDIHKFSFTPDLTDAQFGGSISGIALQFKLFGLEQIAQTKENFFRLGLKKRLRLITKILNLMNPSEPYESEDIVMTFTRNMPVNVAELVATLLSLKGTISEQTLLSNLPFIDDVAYELKLLEMETGDTEELPETPEEMPEEEEENAGILMKEGVEDGTEDN